ncbi:peptidoglycan D,D-transpeptidase FtsI family protein [Defluviitalea phaphyphila]|uniref:peptidoglycan D,D-transpeptidase FtsI family protein n=1 Tax=Defluviitalea phaphyphila TaxID=1473580 RepID=UPI0007300897|nr:penicillin-binding transpeptidase domain-containing protein [Defluviitalea phaphyphila]
MKQFRKNIKRVFGVYVVMFFSLILYLVKFLILDSSSIIINTYNPRLSALEENIIRGEIRDSKGVVLARTKLEGDTWIREYPEGRDFAHIVGYVQKGKTGVEAFSNFKLLEVSNKIIQNVKSLFTGDKLKGNNVILTLDADIQHTARELLNNQKGAIVVMEPSTGKILSMVSYPDFNPNELNEIWEQLNKDEKNSPLINRATQGLYPPGSVFKIVTASAVLENKEDWENFTYNCTGEEEFHEKIIRCYGGKAHGEVNLDSAFYFSCNTGFAKLGVDIGAENLRETAERLLFNRNLPYELEYSKSQFLLDKNSEDKEIVETAIGQGKTLVSPLHMAMITSAVANGGILMKPYIIDHIETNYGKIKDKTIPKKYATLFQPEIANQIVDMMVEVVEKGTGTKASIPNVLVAGKTGTAENSSGEDHAWFVGFAPAYKPKAVVVVLIENGGSGGSKAGPIARELFKKILNQ